MIYEFHPEAEQEFVEAAAHYERNVTGLGERFTADLLRVIAVAHARRRPGYWRSRVDR
jgi:hypothetical protein